MVPTIPSERLVLRPVEASDLAALDRNVRMSPPIEDLPEGGLSLAELTAWLEAARAAGVMQWAIVHGGEPIGLVRARFERGAIAHLGFYVVESRQGSGYTTEAVRAAIAWIFTETPAHRITLGVTTSNVAMWRVAQRVGFVLEGVARACVLWAGSWHDARYYALLRSDWQAEMTRHERGGRRAFVPTTAEPAPRAVGA